MRIAQASSLTKCGDLCTMESGCTSFTYVQNMETNCYLMAVEPSSTTSCDAATNAKHYIKVEKTFSCLPDDRMYRTYMLSDGTIFSYRVVHSFVDAETARTDCESSGGFLAKLSTVAKLEMIQDLMKCTGFGQLYYYVDGSNADYSAQGTWTWNDGAPVNMNSTFWGNSTPDFPLLQHCLVIDWSLNWRFDDQFCNLPLNYICEKA